MNGKNKCRILKEIRKRIAEENGIEYAVSDCKHKGNCLGTCPKCESEVRYLESELEKKRLAGAKVCVASLALSVAFLGGCANNGNVGIEGSSIDTDETTVEIGGVPVPKGDVKDDFLDGEMIIDTDVPGMMLPDDNELDSENE